MELATDSESSGSRTRTAVESIWTASRRILWICLSIIASAALAGSVERMNRFITLMVCVCVFPITVYEVMVNNRFNFPKPIY